MDKSEVPLIVDLDGTLIKTDILLECIYALIKKNPFFVFSLPLWLLNGKVSFKEQISKRVNIAVTSSGIL